jgi:endo-1,4-beta-xylanase
MNGWRCVANRGDVLMRNLVLRARVVTLLLSTLVPVACSIEGLPPDPQERSLTAGAGGAGGADTSTEPGGAGSPDDSPSAGNSTGGRTSAPNPGDEGGSSAQGTGGSAEAGQDAAGGSEMHTGGSAQTGGVTGQGAFPAGGRAAGGGATDGGAGTGGTDEPGSGGATTGGRSSGGATTGGRSGGGSAGTGGTATGGKGGTATGGAPTGGSGGAATGGSGGAATGGTSSTGGSSAVDCSGTMPTEGTRHCATFGSGTAGSLHWALWSNESGACMTTYSSPAFSVSWDSSGDVLARLGLEWGNTGKPYEEYGPIAAQIAFEKTGSVDGLSFIGVYGWSENPCIEFYIVEDSFSGMPVDPGSTTETDTAEIDGGTYHLYTRPMSGTGGSRCSGALDWTQFYSIRQTARQCGQVSVTEHFDAWKKAGMRLGDLMEVTILVEVQGGSGSIDFTTANVTAQ